MDVDAVVTRRLDADRFARRLRDEALSPYGTGQCVRFLCLALEAGGIRTAQLPPRAQDWGPALLRLGFRLVADDSFARYAKCKGDIAVIDATSRCTRGHVQGCDGKDWVSDFVQASFWPGPRYRAEEPRFAIYRP